VGRSGASGTASLLSADLARKGIAAQIAFLFAVFENPETHVQSIYYSGEAAAVPGGTLLLPFDALPVGVAVYGADRVLRYVNPAYNRILAEVPVQVGESLRDILMRRALAECRGNRTLAAEKLGISRRTLHRKLREHPELGDS
jgi:transcriptional regulator of acetoin/glycerol metabolism